MNNIAPENVPVKHPMVELNESLEDVFQDVLALCAPDPSDVTMELIHACL